MLFIFSFSSCFIIYSFFIESDFKIGYKIPVYSLNCFQTEDDLQSAIFFFGMSNSLVNPLIYGLFHLLPRRRKFFNSFQCSQTTRTGIAEVSHQLMRTNSNLISQMGKPPAKR